MIQGVGQGWLNRVEYTGKLYPILYRVLDKAG